MDKIEIPTGSVRIHLERSWTFDAAHKLLGMPWGHKCARPHGHTYTLTVQITGVMDHRCMLMDLDDLDRLVQAEVLEPLDHHDLNSVIPDNPTAEQVARWVWSRLLDKLPGMVSLLEVVVAEGPFGRAIVRAA